MKNFYCYILLNPIKKVKYSTSIVSEETKQKMKEAWKRRKLEKEMLNGHNSE